MISRGGSLLVFLGKLVYTLALCERDMVMVTPRSFTVNQDQTEWRGHGSITGESNTDVLKDGKPYAILAFLSKRHTMLLILHDAAKRYCRACRLCCNDPCNQGVLRCFYRILSQR